MFLDCCNAYYIVMTAIIESGYRTKTVQKRLKLHVVFGYRKHSNDHDYNKSLKSLSDLLTLSQV